MMSITTETIGTRQPLRPQIGRLRLRMKPAHRSCGYVQGAWWPQSTRLTAELPPLLAALTLRLGPIERVRYHDSDWSGPPHHIEGLHTDVVLDAADSPHAITVFGTEFGQLRLLVVPPYTDPHDAYTAVTTAASADDASTPDQLLGISPHRPQDHQLARLALHRWETEGGAVYAMGV
jgi:Family of unknown function (DUF5994)